jgi:hypothetical protein
LFGYLDNVATASEIARQEFVASARSAGAEIVVFYAGTAHEIDSAFEAMVQTRLRFTGQLIDATSGAPALG